MGTALAEGGAVFVMGDFVLGHDTTTEMAPNWGFFPLHVLLMEMKVILKSRKEMRVCSSPANFCERLRAGGWEVSAQCVCPW